MALWNYKKGFIAYLVYQIFWLYSVALIKIGSKTIILSMGMTLYFLILYYIKKYNNKVTRVPFPYRIPFCLVILSAIVTCLVGLAGFGNEFTRAISNILQDIVIVWLIWKVIETKQDFRTLFKYITIIIFIACLYSLIEYIFKNNILLNYKNMLMNGEISIYPNDSFRGYRICSMFEHPIGAGMCFSLYFIATFSLIIRFRETIPKIYFSVITALLCIPCILLTKMRAALLFAIIGSLIFVNIKNRRFIKLLIGGSFILIIAIPFLGEYINVFLSLFNINKLVSYTNTGSSLVQRMSQFKSVYHLMMLSPVGGLGELFKEYITNQYTNAALAYESIWLEQMAKHGLLGVLSNLILLVYSCWIVPYRYKSKECMFLGLAYWIVYSLTSIPSFRTPLYYLLMFYLIKRTDTYCSKDNYRSFRMESNS